MMKQMDSTADSGSFGSQLTGTFLAFKLKDGSPSSGRPLSRRTAAILPELVELLLVVVVTDGR